MRVLGKLSLLIFVALVLATASSSPAAASIKFEAAEYDVAISGEQLESQTLNLEGGVKVVCKNMTLSGALPVPGETVSVTPTFSQCVTLGLIATVQANGCQYVFKATEKVEASKFKGTVGISCPAGQSIVVTFGKPETCEAQIGTQSGLSTATYRNEVGPSHVKVEESLSGIHYTVTKDSGFCPYSGTGEKTNGSLTGNSRLNAVFGAEAVGLGLAEAAALTRLCNAAPVNFFCPMGETLKAGQVIKGSIPKTSPASTFLLLENGTIKNRVDCSQSTVNLKTKEEFGNPLKIEDVTFTFVNGTCATNPGKTACTVAMTNAPTTGAINVAAYWEGWANLIVPITVKLECGADVEQCVYSTAANYMWIKGGSPAAVTAIGTVPFPNTAGKKGCFTDVAWTTAAWEITSHKGLWPTY